MEQMNLGSAHSDEIMGIDLGTTNCAVSIYTADTVPTLLPVGKGGKFTVPSCVKWERPEMDGCKPWTVGEEAYRERFMLDVVYSIKRMMGSGKKVRFTDRNNHDHYLELTPAEISSIILSHLKDRVAELYRPVKRCVITVPAYFNQRQIEDTIEAAKLAELECVQILKEPTSASYIYSLLGHAKNGSVLIYDLGGGTFDVTHMNFLRRDSIPKKLLTSLKRQYGIELENVQGADLNEQYFCRILGTYGDVHLGGDDIDKEAAAQVIRRNNLQLNVNDKERLCLRCEECKKSGVYSTEFKLDDRTVTVTQDDVNKGVKYIFEKTLKIMGEIDMDTVSTIVLVGGSTKSEYLRKLLSDKFPDKEISAVLDPDATVALGAGSVAKAVANDDELLYSDVLPLPIGILVDEKDVEVCIPKNTSMPYTAQREFYTLHDNQTQVTAHVYQGLSKKPEKCTYLGKLTLTDIPLAPAGEVKILVNFLLTSQGRLRVISSIAGRDKEEVLIVDNIFAVNDSKATDVTDSGLDDFESAFMSSLQGNEEADRLFKARRECYEDTTKRLELEDKIVALML